jgi:CO dehydrogenase maturation factor
MADPKMRGPVIMAVCGKGGVGKTSVSAAIVRILLENPANRVLAIDADPAVGLAQALGIEVRRTVDDVRNDLIGKIEGGGKVDRKELLAMLDYRIFEAVSERGGLAFLAIGRPEREGCYCKVNDLLRGIIESLTESFDYVVIDGEAGIEQVNRRVLEKVTHLVQVSDASVRGINVARTILEVARAAVRFEKAALILNKIRGGAEAERLDIPAGLELAGWLPDDDAVREGDIRGASLLDLPAGAFLEGVRGCLKKMEIVA